MAGVAAPHDLPPIRVTDQIRAISYLRWRLFANAFRRKGGKGELIARIIVYPVALFFVLIVVGIAGGAGYLSANANHLETLALIFTGITVFQVVVSINIAPPGMSFDPEALIRYPLRFRTYLILRLMLGLFSASTVFGTAALLAAAAGVTIAQPHLGVAVFAAALALALTNMLFIRMIFAWIDRWLSTRRAREILTGFFLVFTVGFQYLNVTFNNLGHHSTQAARLARYAAALRFYHAFQSYLAYFPSGRGAAAVLALRDSHPAAALLNLLVVLAFAAVFLGVFGRRIRREYLGENLSQGSVSAASAPVATQLPAHTPAAYTSQAVTQPPGPAADDLAICLSKEWIYIRRNISQLYGVVAPLAMVLIFAGRLGNLSRTVYVFPAAVAYALLGTAALTFNSFGMDGSGVQLYFLAPVRMRTVLFAKNLFAFGINCTQLLLVYVFFTFTATPPTLPVALSTVLWAMMMASLNATLGNRRSLTTPTRMDPTRLQRRQASGLSAIMALGLVLGTAALGAGLLVWAAWTDMPWLPVLVLAVLAALAIAVYVHALGTLDSIARNNREHLIEVLAKV